MRFVSDGGFPRNVHQGLPGTTSTRGALELPGKYVTSCFMSLLKAAVTGMAAENREIETSVMEVTSRFMVLIRFEVYIDGNGGSYRFIRNEWKCSQGALYTFRRWVQNPVDGSRKRIKTISINKITKVLSFNISKALPCGFQSIKSVYFFLVLTSVLLLKFPFNWKPFILSHLKANSASATGHGRTPESGN